MDVAYNMAVHTQNHQAACGARAPAAAAAAAGRGHDWPVFGQKSCPTTSTAALDTTRTTQLYDPFIVAPWCESHCSCCSQHYNSVSPVVLNICMDTCPLHTCWHPNRIRPCPKAVCPLVAAVFVCICMACASHLMCVFVFCSWSFGQGKPWGSDRLAAGNAATHNAGPCSTGLTNFAHGLMAMCPCWRSVATVYTHKRT